MKENKIKYFVMVILSSCVMSVALTSFSIPGQFYPSGISGLSRLLSDVMFDYFNIQISYSIFYFSFNVLLASFTFKYLGKWFTILTLLHISSVSILTSFLKPIIALDDELLIAIFGGIINGLGAGFALQNNASTGGLDFVTIYFSNKYKKSFWNQTFIFNSIIVIASGVLYGWERACYSIIYQFCSTTMVKKIHNRYTHQIITIITKKPLEVCDAIFAKVRHGITSVEAKGMFKQENVTILYTIVNSFQSQEVINIVLEVDSKAFINVQNTLDIKGNFYQKPLD